MCFLSICLVGPAGANISSKEYVDRITTSLSDSKEDKSNKLTSTSAGNAGITAAATDVQYPSAKATYDIVNTKVGLTGDETVSGTKTFSSAPIIPTQPLPSP